MRRRLVLGYRLLEKSKVQIRVLEQTHWTDMFSTNCRDSNRIFMSEGISLASHAQFGTVSSCPAGGGNIEYFEMCGNPDQMGRSTTIAFRLFLRLVRAVMNYNQEESKNKIVFEDCFVEET